MMPGDKEFLLGWLLFIGKICGRLVIRCGGRGCENVSVDGED